MACTYSVTLNSICLKPKTVFKWQFARMAPVHREVKSRFNVNRFNIATYSDPSICVPGNPELKAD